jgi:phosphoribosylformimino-5-aminoimidazole carboxamide ribotide isomerase
MLLYPAIDIRGGKAVRLVRGDYDRETAFDDDPLEAARRWLAQGAQALHVVDLDGARAGHQANLDHARRIAAEAQVPVQLGGGLRDAESVAEAIDAGVARVVLGTAALEDPALVEALVAEHGERIVIAADARSGAVAVEGWERETAIGVVDLIGDLARRGVRRFIYTPVEVDGTLEGPAVDGLREAADAARTAEAELIYSGGVGTLDHLRTLAELDLDGLGGVIVGRALYEGRFTVGEGQAALGAR